MIAIYVTAGAVAGDPVVRWSCVPMYGVEPGTEESDLLRASVAALLRTHGQDMRLLVHVSTVEQPAIVLQLIGHIELRRLTAQTFGEVYRLTVEGWLGDMLNVEVVPRHADPEWEQWLLSVANLAHWVASS